MAVYRVWAESISYVYIDIEAESEDKARELAEQIDGGEFHEEDGSWEYGSVTEMEDDVEPDYRQDEIEG